MIVFERFGKNVKINNVDWKNIRRRLNPDNANCSYRIQTISLECSLCQKYKLIKPRRCESGCPFKKYESKKHGCTEFIQKIIGTNIRFVITVESVSWYDGQDKQVRLQFKKLNDFIDKIEKENQNAR